jgi:hypothetical protein
VIRGLAPITAICASVPACADDGGPRLDDASPAAALPGAMVTLSGERLCGPSHDCTTAAGNVLFGVDPPQIQAPIVSYTDTSAVVGVPALAPLGMTAIVVNVDGRASNALPFEVLR